MTAAAADMATVAKSHRLVSVKNMATVAKSHRLVSVKNSVYILQSSSRKGKGQLCG
jgi:hypothetical protein